MPLRYDPEWHAQARAAIESELPELPVGDIDTRRGRFEGLHVPYKVPDDIELITHKVKAADGYAFDLLHVSLKERKSPEAKGPAVLHIHGGGFISVNAINVLGSLVPYVRESGVPLFSVDYRWAPENLYPIPIEDCWSALQFVRNRGDEFGIDTTRIAVMGESAGGGLAAGVAILARERQLSPPLAKQILIYPMLDDRTAVDHTKGLAVFSVTDVLTGWQAYLGDKYNAADLSPVAAPARITDVTGLPELYLDIGQLDMFLHENITFANKFLQAGIQAEVHIYAGVIHAFQRWGGGTQIVKHAFANRLRAITTL